jgi:DNA adenine methylase
MGGFLAPSPFLKWAGGKGQLLESYYKQYFPRPVGGKYIEPFVGGGAVFFCLYTIGALPGRIILNDLNEELINCYKVIRDNMEELIKALERHDAHKTDKGYYLWVRNWDRDPASDQLGDVERAARTIFLNKTCYNGLHRVNRKGQFNVPYGGYKNPTIFEGKNLRAVKRALQGVTLNSEDFSTCLNYAQTGDFVYLDPPYHPASATSNFTKYTKEDFGEEDQARLFKDFLCLNDIGCQVMLSNSDTELVRRLYADFKIIDVKASRAISRQTSRLQDVAEIIILNY